jgi:hypothetical protein
MNLENKPIEQSNLIGTQKLSTPFGQMAIDNTYPTNETMQRIYEVRDIQRAVELFIWALPIVQFQAWKEGQAGAFGEGYTIYTTFAENAGIIISNATTPYIMGWPNLNETGPIVVDMPGGLYASAILDWWEYPVCDLGLTGPDKGDGGKYIIVGPTEDPQKYADQADFVFQSSTNKLFIGFRVLKAGEQAILEFMGKIKVYPLAAEPTVPRLPTN